MEKRCRTATLAGSLLVRVGEDDPHRVVLDELQSAFPGCRWALVERVGTGACEASVPGEVSEVDVLGLSASLWGTQVSMRIPGSSRSALHREPPPSVTAWSDSSREPAIGLARWTSEGSEAPSQ